ncbi:MAG: Tryptophan 2,3-dioxygenase [Chroococcidiopsis sp. SAG 2025]|uniref:tryptophan 2,3-dioxygenase family protein n=1 Tax=Chroococcidiopsis sp. SAG 2025 TaxID=171389 RepID=UPI002936F1C6|nr:tryptophan 2,3-dioxygenase family protein [Chroococcidiopsis sp. SAG 2025]MDV2990973.1 Tryptophan 2,3-dioxygenase [Chroococcidiopsis sp. SAG 2025]
MSESYQPLPPLDPNLEIGNNHYWNYHNIEALISCKKPLTASKDEDLFITVHQICELAFHQMTIEMGRVLNALLKALDADSVISNTSEACYFFQRVLRLYEVVNTTMPILTTMRAFAEFRTSIGPTSGFQSIQFRHLEIMSGVRKYWVGGTKDAEGKLHIAETEFDRKYGDRINQWFEQYKEHNLTYYYDLLISRAVGNTQAEKVANLRTYSDANAVLNFMQAYDKCQTQFHQGHLGLAIQQLKIVGVEVGTGGTSFKDYLAKYHREEAPLFPGLS